MELILSREIIGKTIINSDILTVWHRGVCLSAAGVARRTCIKTVTYFYGQYNFSHISYELFKCLDIFTRV